MGNTHVAAEVSYVSPVHPHACGEHIFGHCLKILCIGSSPRLWGTRRRSTPRGSWCRFIPTPVGNTIPAILRTPCNAVHPHACGEHLLWLRPEYQSRGSSPRLWGTHVLHGGLAIDVRFIPTPVGNTFGHDQNIGLVAVHPHACGEHTSSIPLISCSVFKEQNATKKSAPLFKFSSPSDSLLLVRTKPA